MDDEAEETTALNLDVDTAGVTIEETADEEPATLERALPMLGVSAADEERLPADEEHLPADEEFPTALVPPDALQRELERSRESAVPEPVLAELEPIAEPAPSSFGVAALTGEAHVATLMASSIERVRHELPTAPAPFSVVKLDDAAAPAATGPGGTVVIPKNTLAQVLSRAPKVTSRMPDAPDFIVRSPPFGPPQTAVEAVPRATSKGRTKTRGRVALVLLLLVFAASAAVGALFFLRYI